MIDLWLWRDELYRGALNFWPNLTPQQFDEATHAWFGRQSASAFSRYDVAEGIEEELLTRLGPPAESNHP